MQRFAKKCMVYDCMSLSLSKRIDCILVAPYLKPLLWGTPEPVLVFYFPFWGIIFCSHFIQSNYTDYVFSHKEKFRKDAKEWGYRL